MSDTGLGGNSKEQLKSIVERVEKLEDDKSLIGADIKDLYCEAKGAGYNPKAIRAIIRQRKADKDAQEALEADIEAYKLALGMAD